MQRLKPTKAGGSIATFIVECIGYANATQRDVEMEFNGTVVRVYPGSHEYDIADKWSYKREMDRLARGGA